MIVNNNFFNFVYKINVFLILKKKFKNLMILNYSINTIILFTLISMCLKNSEKSMNKDL